MWVTFGLAAVVVALGAGFVVVGYRKLDDLLKSLETCFKLD